jgi:hypothetical protein
MGIAKAIGAVLTWPLLTGIVAVNALGAALPESVQVGATVADKAMSWSTAWAGTKGIRAMRAQESARAIEGRMEYSTIGDTERSEIG